jgi:hypothetical protein
MTVPPRPPSREESMPDQPIFMFASADGVDDGIIMDDVGEGIDSDMELLI